MEEDYKVVAEDTFEQLRQWVWFKEKSSYIWFTLELSAEVSAKIGRSKSRRRSALKADLAAVPSAGTLFDPRNSVCVSRVAEKSAAQAKAFVFSEPKVTLFDFDFGRQQSKKDS